MRPQSERRRAGQRARARSSARGSSRSAAVGASAARAVAAVVALSFQAEMLPAVLLLSAVAAPPAPPAPPTPCQAALVTDCSAALKKCSSFPCTGCEMCIINNQGPLQKAGCTAAQETGYCAAPPLPPPPAPLSCTHTDSRGDSYDLSGVPKVDGKWATIDKRPGQQQPAPASAPRILATAFTPVASA